ncbi:hypothetical protein M8J77_023265 [Diaphorina citri]|nr:hypothetical protein M8J77_023265 [Diaphorina citri]
MNHQPRWCVDFGSGDENVLNLSSAGSSDSEEGEEGGGWDFVQGGQDARTLATHTSHTITNFDSDSDDMNHPLNPDAAEFVPVTSPGLTKPNRAAPWETNHHEDVQLGNGVDKHGGQIHGFDQIHEDKTRGDIEIHGAKDAHGADIPLGRVEHAIDDIISCSPKKPNPLKRLNDESEFFSEISKRPSGVFDLEENGVHDDTNGFEPMDISRAQATLGDSTINYMADLSSTFTSPGHTSSLSPSSPELNTNDQRRELDEFEPSEHKSELDETEHHENTKYNEVKTEHHELNTDLNAFNPVEHNEFHAEHNELNIGHNELNNEHNELNTEYNAFATEHNELNTEHEFNIHSEFHAKDNELNAEQNAFASATERYETMNPFENPFDKDSTHQVTGSAFERSTDAFSNDFTNVPEENVTKNPESLHAGSVSDVVPDVTSKAEETLGEDGVSHGKADLDAFESQKTTDETAKTTNDTTEITTKTTSDTANSGETLDAAIAESEFTADQTKFGEFDDLETKLSHDENKGNLLRPSLPLDLSTASSNFEFDCGNPMKNSTTIETPGPKHNSDNEREDTFDIYSVKTLSNSGEKSLNDSKDFETSYVGLESDPHSADVGEATSHPVQTLSLFDSNTFNEFHTANSMWGEYSDLSSSQPVSVVEETLTSMMDMLVTPKPSAERRVSSDVLDAYNAVVHALDTPAGGIIQPCGTPVKDEFDLKAEAELSNGLQVEEEDVANGSYIETEPHFQKDGVESHPLGHDQTHSETRDFSEVATSNNPFGDAGVELHQTETDEFEFHQENNVTVDAVDRVESEANVETFIISGITPLEFLQKHAAEPVEESAKELIEDLTNEIRAEPEAHKAFADSIKEEDEEEIQIGKKVSDLNESDPMSRSFYGDFEEPARSPSPEEMIDHYERQQREATHEVSIDQAVEQFHADNEAELTPTSEVTTLEAKLASDNHVENSVSNVDKPVSNLFEISTEETSYNEKPQEHDDLTFETKESSFQEETHTETKVESSFQETHVALETNLDDFTSQETKLDDFISAHTEKTPEVSEPKEEVLDDLVSVPTSVPDVVPNQDANEESPSPAVDLTQDIVEEKEAVVTPTDETNSETAEKETPLSEVPVIPQEAQTVESAEESTASSDLAAKVAGALVVGAAAAGAAVAVKKATAAKKTDKPGPAAKPASKPLAKTTTTKTTTAAKPAISPVKKTATTTAKPAPKPATKPAPKPTTAAPKSTTTAPKPAPVRKPVASTITKTATSTVSAAPKPSAPKPAAPKKPVAAPAPKPRPATAAPAPKPLTNGVTKRPVSATTTASRTSSSSVTSASAAKPAAPRVPLSQRTSAAKPATKPATAKPSTTSKPTTASKPATATRPATTTSKPATTTSTGVKKTSTTSSSVTRKPLSSVTSKVSSNLTVKKSPAGVKSASAIKKTETPSEPKVDSASEAPTTNGIQEPAPLTNGVEELTTPSPILTNGH